MQKHTLILAMLLIMGPGSLVWAHEDVTNDPEHDTEHLDENTGAGQSISATQGGESIPTVNQKNVIGGEEALPYLLLIFAGLGLFAFAMGKFMAPSGSTGKHPHFIKAKSSKRE